MAWAVEGLLKGVPLHEASLQGTCMLRPVLEQAIKPARPAKQHSREKEGAASRTCNPCNQVCLTALPAKPSKQGLSVHFQRSTRVEHEAPATTHAISNMSTQHVTQRRMCWLQGTDRPGKYNLRRPSHHRQSASCLQSMSLRGECAGYRAQTGQASRK